MYVLPSLLTFLLIIFIFFIACLASVHSFGHVVCQSLILHFVDPSLFIFALIGIGYSLNWGCAILTATAMIDCGRTSSPPFFA